MLKRLRYLWPFLVPHQRQLVLGLSSTLSAVVVSLASPLLVGTAVDALRREASREIILAYAGLILGLSVVQGIFSYLQRMILVTMSRDIELELRNRYFASLEAQPPGYFHDHPTGDLMARATRDLEAVRLLCGPAIMYSATTLATGVGAIVLMLRINGLLSLLALVTMPLVALATNLFGRRIHALFTAVQEKFADVTSRVQESFAGIRVVRAYAREEREREELRRINRDYLEGNRRLIGWSVAFHPLLQCLVGLGFVAVLFYGGVLVIRNRISVGEFVSFQLFLGKLVWPMIALGWVINLAQRGTASLLRIREVLDQVPAIRDEEPLVDPGRIAGAVRFARLDFAYREGGPRVLSGIDLDVEAGQTVAVVGRTGAGKSTLLALLARLFDPPPGTVWVDGIDVRRLPLARLRGAIGMVPQETFLFSTTIRENIALGRPAASTDEIAEAARLAGLAPDLASFPEGLDTVVGERGLTLSGGQKQRVALARAILRDPRLLLLDDCLSAVDTHTEEQILTNLRQVLPGRTVFMVSHRVSAVEHADLILVLDRGEIVELGTHAELVGADGLYADLYRRQMLEEELAAV